MRMMLVVCRSVRRLEEFPKWRWEGIPSVLQCFFPNGRRVPSLDEPPRGTSRADLPPTGSCSGGYGKDAMTNTLVLAVITPPKPGFHPHGMSEGFSAFRRDHRK